MHLLTISLNADPLLSFGMMHGGGQSKYVLELGKNLVGRGWNIDVVTLRYKGVEAMGRVTEGFLVHRISRLGDQDYDYDIQLAEVRELARRHPQKLALERYDAVLCCYWLSGVYLMALDPPPSLPQILTLCSLGSFKQVFEPTAAVQNRMEIERHLVARFDHIIATNQGEQVSLEEVYRADPEKIHTIPRGVNLELFGGFRPLPVHR